MSPKYLLSPFPPLKKSQKSALRAWENETAEWMKEAQCYDSVDLERKCEVFKLLFYLLHAGWAQGSNCYLLQMIMQICLNNRIPILTFYSPI